MFYVEPTDSGSPDLVEGVAPFPLDQTFLLHSRPGVDARDLPRLRRHDRVRAPRGTAAGLPGGFYSGLDSLDGDLGTFNDTEREQIQSIWQRVAEDYAPFDVDVTTQDPGRRGDRPDQRRATSTSAPGR